MRSIIKKNKFLYNLLLFLYYLPKTIYYYILLFLFSLLRINNKKIVVINYNGKGYGDMGKYICNELLKGNYEIYWATTKKYKNTLPDGIKYVKYESIRYLYHLATARIWINNCRFRYGIKKRKKQFYIQTWHGCIGFKKSESASVNSLTKQYILGAKRDSKMANLFISNSDFCSNNYKENFWYNGKILKCGCPRNDIIVNQEKTVIKNVKKFYNIKFDEKVCLYAPTFRVNNSLKHYDMNYEVLLNSLEKKYKGKWKILIRFHPNISSLSKNKNIFNENIIDVTNYPDMQELLMTADFMITDYSSCIFDYAISKKPAVIYASDIEEYIKDRDFLIKLEQTPFPVATNNNELKRIIQNFNIVEYRKKVDNFYINLGLIEPGNSCKEISKIIYKIINERK